MSPKSLPSMIPRYRLLEMVKSRPGGWKVHNLLVHAEKQGYAYKEEPQNDVTLFRWNFWLLHQLFLLKENLNSSREGDLRISSMDIAFEPWNPEQERKEGVVITCPLRDYYMDLNRFWGTGPDEINGLLEDFWRRFLLWDRQEELLERWDIDSNLPFSVLKPKIRALIKETHPDKGGDPEEFRELWEVWQDLRLKMDY